MTVAVLGSTGLLGNAVGMFFVRRYGRDNVHLSYRNKGASYGNRRFLYDPLVHGFGNIPACDYVVNCIGIIKPLVPGSEVAAIMLNSVFPRQLADHCKASGIRLIHITTDCVFSGKDGGYDEDARHDCTDVYGKSKSLGEPENCMVIRTSIIGEEIHKKASLIEWAKSKKGQEVNGFTNHLWNGVTTSQYARVCVQIIDGDLYGDGLFHVHSDAVTKHDLLHLIDKRFGLGLKIIPFKADEAIDRTLATRRELNEKLRLPGIDEQLEQLEHLDRFDKQ